MTAATIQQTNRNTAIIAFGVALVLIAAIAILNPNPAGGDLPSPPSTFFATDGGSRAIYRVLQRLMPKVEQWRLPMTELRNHAEVKGSTMVVMGPPNPLTEREANDLDAWVRDGGQLILTTSRTWDIDHASGDHTKKNAPTGDYLGRHKIYRRPGEGADAITASETKSLGKGRIVYLPDSYAFSNRTLRNTDNAVWLATRASEWGEKVFFDEYHHGFAVRRGFFSLVGLFLFSSPWGFLSLQIALSGAVYIFGCKRRFGKIVEEGPSDRTSPIEAAEALGGLFQTAQARVLSARSIHQYLNMELSRLIGHRVDLLNPENRQRIAGRSRMGKAELDNFAQLVADTLDKRSDRDADLVSLARTASNIVRSLDHGTAARKRHAVTS
jgi:hypothetical protein